MYGIEFQPYLGNQRPLYFWLLPFVVANLGGKVQQSVGAYYGLNQFH